MVLTAPTKLIFIISLVLAVIGILPLIGISVPALGMSAAWALAIAYILLAAGVVLKGI